MTILNIRKRHRKVKIRVKKVLRRLSEGAVGFPAVEVEDKDGKRHFLTYVDFNCSREEWDQIGEGTEVVIYLKESVQNFRLILPKPTKRIVQPMSEKEILPEGDYKWRCLACGKKGGLFSQGRDSGENPASIAKDIYQQHRKASPGCNDINVEVFNGAMQLQEELMKFVNLERVES